MKDLDYKMPCNNLTRLAIIGIIFLIVSISPARGMNYFIPEIKTEAHFARVIYIDPSGQNGNGSMASPYNSLKGIKPEPNTAYLIKRGTILNEAISLKWNNNLLGAYGEGSRPILVRGFRVMGNSKDFTLRDLDIRKAGTGQHDMVLFFEYKPASVNVTVAFCRITGMNTGHGYPYYVIENGAENLVFFNNEVAYCRNNGWWLNADNVKIIRNWFHNINKSGEDSPESTGDIIQSIYHLNNAYIAGNIMDKSNSMWKYTLMLNIQERSEGIVVEYNTFYAPKQGAGGAAIRWTPGANARFSRNLIKSIDDKGNPLVVPFETWQPIALQPEPFGIRDNIIIADTDGSVVAYNRTELHNSNRVFSSAHDYYLFLEQNPDIGLYGSDIDIKEFRIIE